MDWLAEPKKKEEGFERKEKKKVFMLRSVTDLDSGAEATPVNNYHLTCG